MKGVSSSIRKTYKEKYALILALGFVQTVAESFNFFFGTLPVVISGEKRETNEQGVSFDPFVNNRKGREISHHVKSV